MEGELTRLVNGCRQPENKFAIDSLSEETANAIVSTVGQMRNEALEAVLGLFYDDGSHFNQDLIRRINALKSNPMT